MSSIVFLYLTVPPIWLWSNESKVQIIVANNKPPNQVVLS